ncbi:MAG: hypothetical protein ACOYK8_06010 [Alphaproteobacteria bacterium]
MIDSEDEQAIKQQKAQQALQQIEEVINTKYSHIIQKREQEKSQLLSYRYSETIYKPAQHFMLPIDYREETIAADLQSKGVDVEQNLFLKKLIKMTAEALTGKDPPTGLPMPLDMPAVLEKWQQDIWGYEGELAVKQAEAGILTAVTQPSLAVCAMTILTDNLGGANKILGRDVSDLMLHTIAHDVIIPILKEKGFEDEQFLLTHAGSGTFQLLLPPVYGKDRQYVLNQQDSVTIAQEIERRMQDVNHSPIKEFLQEKAKILGRSIAIGQQQETDLLDSSIKNNEAEQPRPIELASPLYTREKDSEGKAINRGGYEEEGLAALPDPKRDYTSGFALNVVHRMIDTNNTLKAGQIWHDLKQECETLTDNRRAKKEAAYNERLKNIAANPKPNSIQNSGQQAM